MLYSPNLSSFLLAMALAACSSSHSPAAPAPEGTAPTASAESAPAPGAAPVAGSSPVDEAAPKVAAAAGEPCGALGCLLFPDVKTAFRALLEERPLVLAVGEAHAQKGAEEVPSATRRFTERMLPLLEGKASDVVLELMVAEGDCGEAEKKTAAAQKPVVERQAAGNQNEFISLGKAAEKRGIEPHLLLPECEDYLRVARAEDAIVQMLAMIAELTSARVQRILARNEQRGKGEAMVLAYGGAIHNDVPPREGRERWSFGPELVRASDGRYLALDIIVPEFIKDNDSWRALPWYEHFDSKAHPDRVTLYKTSEHSYTLIFSASR